MMRFVLGALACVVFAAGDNGLSLDFSKEKLPDGWSLSSKAWKVADGELKGAGDGTLAFAGPLHGDFRLSFKGWSAEKANFEVKLYDAKSGAELYTFAFLGRYHSVLDGVKCCILRGEQFVKIDPKMWIFPGRVFTFEVRFEKGQLQMYLDGELGPFFVDPQPQFPKEGLKLQIGVAPEGSRDALRIDDVKITFPTVAPGAK